MIRQIVEESEQRREFINRLEQLENQINVVSQKSKQLAVKKFVSGLKHWHYGEYEFKDEQMVDCVICMEEFKEDDVILVLPCDVKHYFHKKCTMAWLDRKTECPLCREDF